MAKKVIDNQCPSCKAPLLYNAKLGLFKCEFCESEFTIDEINKHKSKDEKVNDEVKEEINEDVTYVQYNCPDCGAEIIADENTAATFCLYCGNVSIIKNRLEGKFAPSLIIPFKVDKDKAVEAFKSLKKGRPLVPSDFVNEKNIEKITGLYIPFWLYNLTSSGEIHAEGVKVTSWSSGDTHYTKRDFYDVHRGGSMKFKRIPVDGSKRFANDIMNTIEPFDYNDLVKYEHAYLSGFLAEKYDVDSNEAFGDAKQRALNTAKDVMLKDTSYTSTTVKSNDLGIESRDEEYVLLPVWMVNVKYKDEFYLFAMNGQTGEFIGNIPLDKRKAVLYGFMIFALVMALIFIITLMMFGNGGL